MRPFLRSSEANVRFKKMRRGMRKNIARILTITGIIGFSGVTQADLMTGLIAHWNFNNCEVQDVSNNGYDAQTLGSSECINGIKGKALKFVPSEQAYLRLNETINTNSFKSLSFWIYQYGKHSLDDYQYFMSKYDWSGKRNFAFSVYDNKNNINRFCVSFYVPGGISSQSSDSVCSYYLDAEIPDGVTIQKNQPMENLKWNHLVFTMDETYFYIYVNNEIVAKKERQYEVYQNDHDIPTYIGYIKNFGGDFSFQYYLNSIIDEIRIYNRTLSLPEIQELYNVGSSSLPDITSSCRATYSNGKLHIPFVDVLDPFTGSKTFTYNVDMQLLENRTPLTFELRKAVQQ